MASHMYMKILNPYYIVGWVLCVSYVHENIEPLLYSWLGFMASHMYIKILNPYYIVGWVLWHLNHCRLFNVKSCLYMYIKYI